MKTLHDLDNVCAAVMNVRNSFSERVDFKLMAVQKEHHELSYSNIQQLFLSVNLSRGMTRDPVQQHSRQPPLEQDGNSLDQMANLLSLLLPSMASQSTTKLAELL